MARHRTIKPEFPHWPGIGRVGRDERLLFIYLWTVVDDAGRWKMDREFLLDHFFDYDTDAPMCLAIWLGNLARESLIEFYRVGDVEFLRVIKWRKLQAIDHPTRSKLPAPPSEADGSRETREESSGSEENPASEGDPRENDFFVEAGEPTPEMARAARLRIARKAEKKGHFGPALRAWDRLEVQRLAEAAGAAAAKPAGGGSAGMKDVTGSAVIVDDGMPLNGMLVKPGERG